MHTPLKVLTEKLEDLKVSLAFENQIIEESKNKVKKHEQHKSTLEDDIIQIKKAIDILKTNNESGTKLYQVV